MNAEKARAEDIGVLVEMRLAYLREDHGGLDEGEAEAIGKALPEYFQKHLDRDLSVWLIRDGSRAVSCAFLLTAEKPMSPAFLNGRTGTVLNVYTRPAYRRRGCAEEVMKALLREAGEKELSRVELKSTPAGQALYRKLGFEDGDSRYRLMTKKG